MDNYMQGMINSGQLGYSNPQSNIIPIGQAGYNQQSAGYRFNPVEYQQPMYNYNQPHNQAGYTQQQMYNQQQNQDNQGGGFNPYANQQNTQGAYQQPMYNYGQQQYQPAYNQQQPVYNYNQWGYAEMNQPQYQRDTTTPQLVGYNKDGVPVYQAIGGYNNGYQQRQFRQQTPYVGRQSYDYGYERYANNNNSMYNRGYTPSGMNQATNTAVELMKIKAGIAGACLNKEYSEESIQGSVVPQQIIHTPISDEERVLNTEYQQMRFLQQIVDQPPLQTNAMRTANNISTISSNYHKAFDNMSLCEFLEDHLWKFQREEWIKNNIDLKNGRDFSRLYSSKDYNDLLRLHSSSSGGNPYLDRILNNSGYDNNLDDMEVGINSAFDAERRRRQLLEGKVPEFISSDDTQKRRSAWLNTIFEQMYKKKEGAV